jgi:hypothetical protein
MRYFKLFGLALVAVCAVGAMLVSSAFALPTLLIGTTGEGASTWTGENVPGTVTTLETTGAPAKVECKKAVAEGTVEAKKPLGTYHINFKECADSVLKKACTGTGDEAGLILTLGTWHLVYDTLKAGLTGSGVAILFLTGKVNFECTATGAKIEVKEGGMVLCLILNPEALTKTFEFHCKLRVGSFGPEETKYDNEAGTMVSITPLEAKENAGAFKESVQVGLGTVVYPEDTLIMI